MSRKWVWLTIGAVAAGFLIMAIAARYSEPKQSEAAASSRQVPAPAPLTFRERKERGLLTPEEQRIVDEIEKMKERNKEYEKQRQIRVAKEEAAKAKARQRQDEWNAWVTKRESMKRQYYAELDHAAFDARVEARALQMMERDNIRKWRYQHGLPTQNPTWWEKVIGYADGDPW